MPKAPYTGRLPPQPIREQSVSDQALSLTQPDPVSKSDVAASYRSLTRSATVATGLVPLSPPAYLATPLYKLSATRSLYSGSRS